MKKIFVVTGQTATGKTSLAVDIAKKHKAVLVNFDSRHVYKYLDIVSGKDLDSVKDVEFLLHSFIDPKDSFSSFEYRQKALKVISKHEAVVLVGGTYLYIYNLLYGIKETGEPDWKLRKSLEEKPVEELQDILKAHSVQSFERLNNSERNNPQRLMRKIELVAGGHEVTDTLTFEIDPVFRDIEIEMVGLKFRNRAEAKKTISKRVADRIKKGGVEEVENLLKKGYDEFDPGLRTIGYSQIIRYLGGNISKEEMIKEWTSREIQYAKRQFTFIKRDPNIAWKTV